MSARHDKARETRWKKAGNGRLTMRITAGADAVLNRLARQHRCTRRDVVEGLILGTITAQVDPEVTFGERERLSPAEVLDLARAVADRDHAPRRARG